MMRRQRLWHVLALMEYQTTVLVRALSATEARAKFDEGDWEEDGHRRAELVNWKSLSAPKEGQP